jgi:hypothetical protein
MSNFYLLPIVGKIKAVIFEDVGLFLGSMEVTIKRISFNKIE